MKKGKRKRGGTAEREEVRLEGLQGDREEGGKRGREVRGASGK